MYDLKLFLANARSRELQQEAAHARIARLAAACCPSVLRRSLSRLTARWHREPAACCA